jgi:hypothetical protein
MKRSLIALAILVLGAGTALAAPGEPRVVQGTLEWPATLSAEPFVVIRGEDDRLYYADLSGAQRRVTSALTVGSRVSVLAVEGNQPHELAAVAFGPGDAAGLGITAPGGASTPSTATPALAPTAGPPPEPMWRLSGTVQSVSGTMVTLRTEDGQTPTVDASRLSVGTLMAFRAGDRVTLFGLPRDDRTLVATGYVQSEPPQPAASPRTNP